MTQLAEWIWRACSELGLQIELGFRLVLPNIPELIAIARIPNLGAANGMLVFSSYNGIREFSQHLLDAGYGYSVLDEPASGEAFDVESFKEMFIDWGWSGELGRKPAWMR